MTHFETAVTSLDEKAVADERNDLLQRIDQLNHELAHVVSDNGVLKDTIVRLAMKMVGVTN